MTRLRARGIDCSAEMTGQLEVRGWQDTHLRPGSFDQHATLALVGDVLRDAKENGYVNSAGPKEGWISKIRSGRIRSVVTGLTVAQRDLTHQLASLSNLVRLAFRITPLFP